MELIGEGLELLLTRQTVVCLMGCRIYMDWIGGEGRKSRGGEQETYYNSGV